MKKSVVILCLVLLLFPTILASSIDSEINKITHYAEEYETGNLDYVQLLIYMSSVREKLNEMLGATDPHYGGLLKQEQLTVALGEPQKETKWVWDEKEQHERKLDYYVPIWEKMIFDGKKIQIRIAAHPSLFGDQLIYRLHFEKEFKKPKEQLDINAKIDEVKGLAEQFASDPTTANGDALAKASVNAERTFESYFKQNPGQCVDIMKSIFGSENRREDEKLMVQEIDFYDGENFQVIARLEMCDDCEWNWISLHLWVERRGEFFEKGEREAEEVSPETYENLDFDGFKRLTEQLLERYVQAAENKDFREMNSIQSELWALNEAWNRKANDVWQDWKEANKEGLTKEEQIDIKMAVHVEEERDPYYWIKKEQQDRQKERELRRQNYEDRKQFYLNLFADYYKKEYYFEQTQFEKRLVEIFEEFGKEICDNNIDDNENDQTDCEEDQCSGKVCGRGEVEVLVGNQTITEVRDLYCIGGECKPKEEVGPGPGAVCGNHICEGNETIENCAEDCSVCPEHPPIECDGKVIFKGKDENGCPLEPICIIKEVKTCTTDEECPQPLCGQARCVTMEPGDEFGICKTIGLLECREPDCTDGQEKIKTCDSGEKIIVDICVDGLWVKTDAMCEIERPPEEGTCEGYCATMPHPTCLGAELTVSGTYPDCSCEWSCGEKVVGNECTVKDDCGGVNDVCSNGKCVTLPEVVEEEEEVEEEPETNEEESELSPVTAGAIFNFFRSLTSKFTIPFITAEEACPGVPISEWCPDGKTLCPMKTDEQGCSVWDCNACESEEPPSDCPDPGTPPEVEENCWYKETYDDRGCVSGYDVGCGEWEGGDEWKEPDEGQERSREEDCDNRCERECYDMKVRPCVDNCIRDECGWQFDCVVEDVTSGCEDSCRGEADLEGCEADCRPKCLAGEETWIEPEWEHIVEKAVFTAGGGCRTSQGETGGNIWLNGWGDPFDQLEPLKQKYWEQGEEDWCNHDLENLEKQRREFEKGFDEEFVVWFFEDYLANSAEDWEQHVSGIFELYWNNVDNIMQMAHRMQCLGQDDMTGFNLIDVEYETEYGSLHFWEEMKTATIPGVKEPMTVVTPYMKIWIFPNKEFFKYEMRKSMENHEFPGPPEKKMEREREDGLTEEEKERIRQDKDFMKAIEKIVSKYEGNLDLTIEFKDYETNEVVFNLYMQINQEDIFTFEPMLPSEVPEKDVTIELDFDMLYDMILSSEKEMRGRELESPPWDKRARTGGIKQVTNGVKMYFKIRNLINSAVVYPESAEKDIKDISKLFFKMLRKSMGGDRGPEMEEGEEIEEFEKLEKEVFGGKAGMTGKIIKRW